VAEARRLAKELVALKPDVILSDSTPQTAALQVETRSIPIVFVLVADPIGSGFVAGLPRPGGNLTGFTHLEGTFGGKWLDLLKQVVPGLKRAAAMFNPDTAPHVKSYYLPAFEAAARLSNVEPLVTPVGSEAEIEETIGSLGKQPGGGLVLMSDAFNHNHRSLIISLATQKRVPTISWFSDFPREGGLLSYGAVTRDIYLRAASYVDRVLKGENPATLPVQAPTQFIMVVNLKTAKALGVLIPASVLAIADEVIE
jgi:putative ABC transport system substrate-binding protein